ncbi:hypothetical protein [Streptomyces sp. UH6]|uniref:zinc finger domain-containing protein n=1 Tax=Streptomyces sp. UH6 TaxID=2748379 RepID=UPI0015D4B2A8|nr:hypothetical protein [Streptomyces sp. UH6]NYV74527.1 hypothetical protein [Streptomyces sp. UH6]
MTKRRRGRTGQTFTATPRLVSYDRPPASEVTVVKADGSVETQPAKAPVKATLGPRRQRRTGPLVCAVCGYSIQGQVTTSTEQGSHGKPAHPTCLKPKRPKAKKPAGERPALGEPQRVPEPVAKKPVRDPGAVPRARGGSGSPTKSPNAKAVPAREWTKVTCPRCKAAPGTPCTVRSRTGKTVTSTVPHQERPQVVRRAWAAQQKTRT